ncbi:folate-binding protein [Marinobacter sp. S0848L]|uniref:CAF17-like 4Fe-4S cluster assembly/insertion protein YgfZ n=1 Tax=Marinobacter sp. S0848L TaxID=2926423 RepID=UPI001FF2A219|nr:folate-binding protein [Marinobacter sp. S0848L]MCK0106040.1 folate-binding protein [Marinobacter sp. S0848L]
MSRQDSQQPTHTIGHALLSDRLMARISGPGTDKFVHGQFTQHVDEVTNEQSLRAAACTHKGRAYCLTRLVRDGEDLLMDFDVKQADATTAHLNKYLMLFRGTTLETLPSARIIGLIGEAAAVSVAGEKAASLNEPGQVLRVGDSHLIRIENTSDHTPRYEWWQTTDEQAVPEDIPEITPEQWLASSISAGVPWLTEASQETYVPQMLNLQHLQGVHFKKGCYTGQEVIARMHFLGQLKKSLHRLSFNNAPQAPAVGTKLLAEGKAVGEVVNALMTGDQSGEMLAVIRHDASSKALSLDGMDEVTVSLQPLPYAVPEQQPSDT